VRSYRSTTATYATSGSRDGMWSGNSPNPPGGVDVGLVHRRRTYRDYIETKVLRINMSAHAPVIERLTLDLPHVEADRQYLGRMTERPRNYTFDPPPGVPRSNAVHETHRVPVYNVRGVASDVSLDRGDLRCCGTPARYGISMTRTKCDRSTTRRPSG
jgi:hypothetical protein